MTEALCREQYSSIILFWEINYSAMLATPNGPAAPPLLRGICLWPIDKTLLMSKLLPGDVLKYNRLFLLVPGL